MKINLSNSPLIYLELIFVCGVEKVCLDNIYAAELTRLWYIIKSTVITTKPCSAY